MTDDIEPVSSERTPLLRSSSPSKAALRADEREIAAPAVKPIRKNAILITLAAFILTLCLGDELIGPAQTRVIEAVVCRHFYDRHDPSVILRGHDSWWDDQSKHGVLLGISERWCKVPQVQGEVATLKGWYAGLDSIGSLVLCIPFGWFADRYGRRPLLIMIAVATLLKASWIQLVFYFWQVFSPRMAWWAALGSLVGGGSTVANAVVFTAITDITTEAERTSQFFRIGAVAMTTMFISPPISAVLMDRNPWFAMLLGWLIVFLPVLFLGFVPETLHNRPHTIQKASPDEMCTSTHKGKGWQLLSSTRHVISDTFSFLKKDLRVGFLVCIFSIHLLSIIGVRDILLQYGSTRYGLSLSRSTLLLSVRAGLNVFIMLLILPALSNYLNRRPAFQAHPSFADLILARGSAIILALGFFVIAFAGNVPWYIAGMIVNTCGWCVMTYVRSLAVGFVEEHAVARTFALLSLADTVGIMIGSPTLAELFRAGVNLGDAWMGLPFLACAVVAVIMSIGLAMMTSGPLADGQDDSVSAYAAGSN